MKRETTKKGAPTIRPKVEEAWIKAWKELEQAKIQAWIERIEGHVKQVYDLEGGNEYKEGRIHIKRFNEWRSNSG